MAPYAVKKASTTAGQTASRPDHNAREQLIDEGDEDMQLDCMDIEDDAENDEIDPSQSTALQKLIIGGLNDQKKRHAVNKKKVKEEYSRAKTELQDSITALFDQHEDQS